MIPRVQEKYLKEVVPALTQHFGYKNAMEVPRLKKIVINMGLGRAATEPKLIDFAVAELAKMTGQKPVVTRSKKAISNFKIRKDMPIGCMVTLRKQGMYEFFDRLCSLALPRVKDFRGVSPKGFDKAGNYTLGLKEHTIFPEIDIDRIENIVGMNITFVTTAVNRDHGRELLAQLGVPFRSR